VRTRSCAAVPAPPPGSFLLPPPPPPRPPSPSLYPPLNRVLSYTSHIGPNFSISISFPPPPTTFLPFLIRHLVSSYSSAASSFSSSSFSASSPTLASSTYSTPTASTSNSTSFLPSGTSAPPPLAPGPRPAPAPRSHSFPTPGINVDAAMEKRSVPLCTLRQITISLTRGVV